MLQAVVAFQKKETNIMVNSTIKQKIIEAFCDLLQQYSFSAIKVTDIISKARIAHMSFYRNYQDKYDLVESLCYEDFNIFVKIYGKNALWKEIAISILLTIKNNPVFYRKLCTDDSSMRCVMTALARVSLEHTDNIAAKCTYAVWEAVLQNWAQNNFKESIDETYWTLVTNLPLCEALSGDELEKAVGQYECKSLSNFREKQL